MSLWGIFQQAGRFTDAISSLRVVKILSLFFGFYWTLETYTKTKRIRPRRTSMKRHIICLSQEQRQALQHLVKVGKAPVRHILHAQILLKVDASPAGPNWSNKQIQEAFGAVESTVWRVRTRFLAEGLPAAVARRAQPAARETQAGRRTRSASDRVGLPEPTKWT